MQDLDIIVQNHLVMEADTRQGPFRVTKENPQLFKLDFTNMSDEGFKNIFVSEETLQVMYLVMAAALGESFEGEDNNENDQ